MLVIRITGKYKYSMDVAMSSKSIAQLGAEIIKNPLMVEKYKFEAGFCTRHFPFFEPFWANIA